MIKKITPNKIFITVFVTLLISFILVFWMFIKARQDLAVTESKVVDLKSIIKDQSGELLEMHEFMERQDLIITSLNKNKKDIEEKFNIAKRNIDRIKSEDVKAKNYLDSNIPDNIYQCLLSSTCKNSEGDI